MGYNTAYKLSVDEGKEHLIPKLREVVEEADYALDEEGGTESTCKWYDHENDLKGFSKICAGTLFTLHGEGEESGDIWVKYFKDGKMQECPARITFDEYDESKLK